MSFKTKDSGQRAYFETGMQRDLNAGKARYDLIVPVKSKNPLLKRWAELMTRGAVKYNARNWEKACTTEELERFRESAFRHFMQWFLDEDDEDHAAAVCFNLQGAEYVKEQLKNPCAWCREEELDTSYGICQKHAKQLLQKKSK